MLETGCLFHWVANHSLWSGYHYIYIWVSAEVIRGKQPKIKICLIKRFQKNKFFSLTTILWHPKWDWSNVWCTSQKQEEDIFLLSTPGRVLCEALKHVVALKRLVLHLKINEVFPNWTCNVHSKVLKKMPFYVKSAQNTSYPWDEALIATVKMFSWRACILSQKTHQSYWSGSIMSILFYIEIIY